MRGNLAVRVFWMWGFLEHEPKMLGEGLGDGVHVEAESAGPGKCQDRK